MNKAFQRSSSYSGNYCDIETEQLYWISGIKKKGTNRHWAGNGKISLDKTLTNEYLRITNQEEIDPNKITLVVIPEEYPVERIEKILNKKQS